MNELRRLLLGEANAAGELVVVTPRGVEIPIGRNADWTVIQFTRLLNQIDGLPETPDRDDWSRRVT